MHHIQKGKDTLQREPPAKATDKRKNGKRPYRSGNSHRASKAGIAANKKGTLSG